MERARFRSQRPGESSLTRGDARVEVFRNRVSDAVVWLIVTFGGLYFLTLLVHEAGQGDPVVASVVVDAIFMLAFLVPAVRFPWHGVLASPAGLVVRNIFKTHRVTWSEIARFEIGRCDPWPQVGVVVLQSGCRIPMTALQDGLASRVAQHAVSELNRQLSEHGTQTPLHDDG